MAEWYERFFTGLYEEVLGGQFGEEATDKQALMLKRASRLRKGACVLDVPCGLGRMSLALARMGMEVTGVDLMGRYIRRARRDAKRVGLPASFSQGDMRDIDFDGEFDVVLNWFTSFGYFSDEDNLLFLKKAHRALRPGGRLVVETMNKSWLLSHFRAGSDRMLGGIRIVTKHAFDPATSRAIDTWRFSKGGRTERHRISLKIFNGADMRAILRKAGFRQVELFGHPPLGRFTRHSKRLMAVARKAR